MLSGFKEALDNRHLYAKEWKLRTGRPVMGYFCTYVPEEIIYAASILPVRVLGSHEPQEVAERYIHGMYCPFCRDCLSQGLKGRYSYLDGLVMARTCVHIYQAYDSWQRHIPVSFNHFLSMPARPSIHGATPFWEAEVMEFRGALEDWLGRRISEEDLARSVNIFNANRRLLSDIYELRKRDSPPLTGAEAMEMVLSSMVMDKEEHNHLLEQALTELSSKRDELPPQPRLMMLGSEQDDRDLVMLVESLGARVVIDDHCTGTRYFWTQITPNENHVSSIARRYLEKPPCPLKDLVERHRFQHIMKLAQDFRVQGAILLVQKFCEIHEFDMPAITALLQSHGIPTLYLELDTTLPRGQFRNRIEAFLELLEGSIV